jgi:hypothetical protein
MEINNRDIGAFLKPKVAIQNWTGVAAGSGDNTEKVGEIIDRLALAPDCDSVLFVIAGTATIADTKTLTFKTFQLYHDSASNMATETLYAEFIPVAGLVVKTASGAFTGAVGYSAKSEVGGCKQYIRVKITPDLSNTATDTFNLGGVAIFGGADRVPVTQGIM